MKDTINDEEMVLKPKKVCFWKKLSKKRRILLISILVLILLIITALLFFFLKKEDKINKPTEKYEIITKDNYIYSNGVLTLINDDDKEIGTYTCKNKSEKLCYVAYESTDDNFDEKYNYYEDGTRIKTRTKFYFGKYAFIYDNVNNNSKEIVLYDFIEDKELGRYELVKSFYNNTLNITENNYVILKTTEGKYGLFDLDGIEMVTIIEPKYDYLGVINSNVKEENNKLVYRNESSWGLLTFKGKEVFETDKEIKDFNDNYIKTIDENKLYSLYKYDNTMVKEALTYIDILDTYIVTITNNKYLMVFNSDLVPLISNQLIVKNDKYVPKNIFNNDNLRIKEKKCYDVVSVNEVLNINLYKNDDVFENTYNILDGTISFLYDYYSYENGFLYFYKDLEKKELIGSYTCKNKNNLTDTSTAFNNCKIATDSSSTDNYSTPIYNERYVFIYDAPNLVNEEDTNVVLYDLKDKKSLVGYRQVFTSSVAKETKNNVYHEEKATNYITAINKDGEYGVIKITNEGVSRTISFLYKDIQKQNDYLIAKNSNNAWELYTYDGEKLLDGEYMLFTFYAEIIATVDSGNKLLLHDYHKKTLINTPVTLTNITDQFTISMDNLYYNITVNGVTYKYNISTGDAVDE